MSHLTIHLAQLLLLFWCQQWKRSNKFGEFERGRWSEESVLIFGALRHKTYDIAKRWQWHWPNYSSIDINSHAFQSLDCSSINCSQSMTKVANELQDNNPICGLHYNRFLSDYNFDCSFPVILAPLWILFYYSLFFSSSIISSVLYYFFFFALCFVVW